ncbi:MAG: hypothetical protein JWO21_1578 [Solirubrobacterales bacterium]|jgi:Flp pilus assembly protein TadB|nr:hypothetical protein [Solirubrobacterales bacterium]
MSAARRPSRPPDPRNVSRPQDISRLRTRRRDARRRRRLARTDLALGLAGAIVLLVATPGLAIAALIALLVLLLCGLSFFLERRRRVRSEHAERANGANGRAPRASRHSRPRPGVARKERRSAP